MVYLESTPKMATIRAVSLMRLSYFDFHLVRRIQVEVRLGLEGMFFRVKGLGFRV